MKSACVGVLSIIELKNARWNIEIVIRYVLTWPTLILFLYSFLFYFIINISLHPTSCLQITALFYSKRVYGGYSISCCVFHIVYFMLCISCCVFHSYLCLPTVGRVCIIDFSCFCFWLSEFWSRSFKTGNFLWLQNKTLNFPLDLCCFNP
jgi:hypothetical protein